MPSVGAVDALSGGQTMTRDAIIGTIIHSAVTGFLLLSAMQGAATPSRDMWVIATYLGATFATNLYPDLTTRVRITISSVVAAFVWEYLLNHASGK